MPRHSYNHGSNYPTPDSTQPQTNNSQPNTLLSSQSSTNQIADSFLSDVTQGIYSDLSTLDSLSANPATQDSNDLAPHTPESLLYSPAPDASLSNDPNPRKQRELRRSPRNLNTRTPQQSDSASLRSQESPNNQPINQNSSEKSTFPRMGIDTENRDINELRDLITKSNMILDSVHHSHKNDDQMRDIEYLRERQKANSMVNRSLIQPIQPHEVAKLRLGRGYGHKNGNVNFVIANEISNTLLRQSVHYNKMASKFSKLKFIKVEPESEDEQSTTQIASGMRRSSRKRRTAANYSYPRYSYGGGSKRSKTRKRSRSLRKESSKDGGHVDSEVFHVDNEGNKETDELMHELPPVQSGEEYVNNIQDDVDNNVFDNELQGNWYLKHDLRSRKIMLELPEGATENEETEEIEEPVAVAVASSNKPVRSKRPVKRSGTRKPTSKKSAKTTPKRNTSRKSITRKKNKDLEWNPSEVDNESGNNNKAPVTSTPRGTRSATIPKRKSTSRKKNEDLEWYPDNEIDNESDNNNEAEVVAPVTPISQSTSSKRETSRKSTPRKKNEDPEWRPNDEVDNESDEEEEEVIMIASVTSKKATAKKSAKSMNTTDTAPGARTIRNSSSKKTTPKTPKTQKTTRKVRKPARVQGRGGSRGSKSKDRDTEYKYSGAEESESEIEIAANSENQIVQESSDVEMDAIQDIEPNEPNDEAVEEPVPAPTRPKRTRKNAKDPISEPVSSIPRSARSTRGRGGSKRGGRKGIVNTRRIDDDFDNDVGSIHEPSDKEETNVPDVQKIGATRPQKTTKSTRGKGKGRGGHVGGNTAINQPPVPTFDPDVVEISAGNPTALANAVRALAGQNYDIVHSPDNIVDIASIEEPRVPVFIKPHNPATRSTSLNSTPPPELQTKSLHSSNILSWSNDHWHLLKVFYEETKNEFISSGKVVSGNEDVYREVTKKFFNTDINNKTFGEENLRMRIIALESADIEKSNEPSGSIQRRSSIGSNSSRSSRFSVSRYNKAYSNLRDGGTFGTKRKRSESNASTTEDKNENDDDDETEDKISKRLRVEENVPSGSGTTSAASDMNIPRSDSMLSKIFGGWFSGGRSQSNPVLSNEETSRKSANNADIDEDIIEHDGEPLNSTLTRSSSWWK